jgi:hypothetical protein
MTLEDAQMFLAEYQAEVASLEAHGFIPHEQLVWDIEDLEGRIEELTGPCNHGRMNGGPCRLPAGHSGEHRRG